MSLKSVEMQIAVPRTGDAGNLQQQLLQKPIHDQTMLAAAAAKQLEEQRKKSNAPHETTKQLKTNSEGHNKQDQKNHNISSKTNENEEAENIAHPYKGHHIDLSL